VTTDTGAEGRSGQRCAKEQWGSARWVHCLCVLPSFFSLCACVCAGLRCCPSLRGLPSSRPVAANVTMTTAAATSQRTDRAKRKDAVQRQGGIAQ
jgi:hypothetical protein